jgi:hypothetical protein
MKTIYCYLIFDTKNKLTKIGKSIDPKKRLGAIKIGNPNVKLVFYSDKITEQELHIKYIKQRSCGEWFKLNVQDFKDIMKTTKNIPKTLFYRSTIKKLSETTFVDIKEAIPAIVYKFHGIENLYCDTEGNFFYNDRPARIIYNNGSRSVLLGKSKRGIISLRKLAYESEMKEAECPF